MDNNKPRGTRPALPERGKDMKRTSKFVNEFKIDDNIIVYGWTGTVKDIDHRISSYDGAPCTYLQVSFDNPREVGFQYQNGWYGGTDGVVSYGHIEQ